LPSTVIIQAMVIFDGLPHPTDRTGIVNSPMLVHISAVKAVVSIHNPCLV
jgi:hypothetical protein